MKLNLLFDEYQSIVIIIYDEHANVLLGKATNDDDRNGKWCFPAGRINPGETPLEAAVRESYEETGYKVKVEQQVQPVKSKVGFVVCRKISGNLSPNHEFSKILWVPWNKVRDLDNVYPDTIEILKKPTAGFP